MALVDFTKAAIPPNYHPKLTAEQEAVVRAWARTNEGKQIILMAMVNCRTLLIHPVARDEFEKANGRPCVDSPDEVI